MSDDDEAFSYVFAWLASPSACPKCQALNGRQYRDQTIRQPFLVDAQFGPIWDLQGDTSYAHPNCKCTLGVTVFFDWTKIEALRELYDLLGEVPTL